MQESKTGINEKCCNDEGLKARGVEKTLDMSLCYKGLSTNLAMTNHTGNWET